MPGISLQRSAGVKEDWSKEASVPKTSSIRSTTSTEHRLVTDRQTDRHRHRYRQTQYHS